jgi:hypothetical protein
LTRVSQAKNIGQGGIVVWTCSTYKTKTDCINITLTIWYFSLDQLFKVSSCQYLILLQQGSFFARKFSCIFCLLNTSYQSFYLLIWIRYCLQMNFSSWVSTCILALYYYESKSIAFWVIIHQVWILNNIHWLHVCFKSIK